MELFIQIRNGQPFEHPIFGDNFREAFPHIDVNNLPTEFARFERIQCPFEKALFKVHEVTYQWENGIVKDVWSERDANETERAAELKEITESLFKRVENYKVISQAEIDHAATEQIKQLWVNYLAALNAWVLVDPLNPRFPRPPVVEDDLTVYTVNDAGSAPNVIE
jgi:hypothetical protein